MARRITRWAVVATTAILVLSGCTDDDGDDGGNDVAGTSQSFVLAEGDVPGATGTEDLDLKDAKVATGCGQLSAAQLNITSAGRDDRTFRVITADGVQVESGAFNTYEADQGRLFDSLDRWIATCSEDSLSDEEISPVEGLPEGWLGFTSAGSQLGETVTRVWAPVGDWVVMAGVRVEDGQTSDLVPADLVRQQIERVEASNAATGS